MDLEEHRLSVKIANLLYLYKKEESNIRENWHTLLKNATYEEMKEICNNYTEAKLAIKILETLIN